MNNAKKNLNRICDCGYIALYASQCNVCGLIQPKQNYVKHLPDICFRKKCLSIKEWSNYTGISPQTLYERIYKLKWSKKKALTTPTRI